MWGFWGGLRKFWGEGVVGMPFLFCCGKELICSWFLSAGRGCYITVTRTEKKVPINEIASSHMARRTFIGNIYKLVKDPNLVSALTGHVEGSRAFTRYRTIDIDMKKDLVKILEGVK